MSARSRTVRLLHALEACGVDLFLVHNNSDLRWLTGLSGVFDDEAAHHALVGAGMCVLHTDSRYINAFEARRGLADGWEFTTEPRGFASFVAERLAGLGRPVRLGFEGELSYSHFTKMQAALIERGLSVEFSMCERLIEELRSVKDEAEIEALAASQQITDAAFAHILSFMKEGMTEIEVAFELERFMRSQGAQGLAFPSIVAAGENGASPHGTPGRRRLRRGDMVVMDFGARLDDFCSDMTRTVVVGHASEEQREAYATVLLAQESAKAAISVGKSGSEMHAIAADVIDSSPFAGSFVHSLGHGVGIDIHESPTLSPRSDNILVSGNVVTVEPGIYLPGKFGIRIEDFGVVRPDGFSCFTASNRELIEV